MAESALDDASLIHKAFREDNAAVVAEILDRNPEYKAMINEPVGPFDSPAITNVKSPEMLDVVLAAGGDINVKSRWWAGGFGLLHVASPELAKYAIERGADVDVHAAARLGLIDILRDLIAENPQKVHERGGDGQTPLHFAANVEIAKFLLEHGADIDARDIDHVSTPAQYMVASRQDVARYLVSRGCSTDILLAAALGDSALVSTILDRDPEAIRVRVSEEYFPLVSKENGGSIYQWELGWYLSAHQVARRFGHEQVFELLWTRSPADVKLVNACWLGDQGAVEALLAETPDLGSMVSPSEQRMLAHAARNNDLKAVRLMVKSGLAVNGKGQSEAKALHWASWHGNLEMVRLLLEAGGDVADTDNEYNSAPLTWALRASVDGWHPDTGDYPGVVEMLIRAGAELPKGLRGSEGVQDVLRRHGVPESSS